MFHEHMGFVLRLRRETSGAIGHDHLNRHHETLYSLKTCMARSRAAAPGDVLRLKLLLRDRTDMPVGQPTIRQSSE